MEPTGIINFIQKGGVHAGYDFTKYEEADWTKGQVEDMMKAGIVDPLKVTRLALEHAVSIASTLVTTEAIITDKPEPRQLNHPKVAWVAVWAECIRARM